MDILVELPLKKWPELMDRLKEYWPLNAPVYNALCLNLQYVEVRNALQFKVYCPYGDMNNGFVISSLKDGPEYVIWTISGDTRKLEKALMNSKILDWSQKVLIESVSSVVLKLMERLRPLMNLRYFHVGMANMYYLDKTTEPFRDLSCPPNTYLAPVRNEVIDRVDAVWPYRHAGSPRYFSILAQNGLSYALYSESDDTLLAWMFLNEYLFLCHLYCDERFRRHGFAKYLMKYVTNEQLVKGNDLCGYVVHGNETSAALFEALGFEVVYNSAYLYVQK